MPSWAERALARHSGLLGFLLGVGSSALVAAATERNLLLVAIVIILAILAIQVGRLLSLNERLLANVPGLGTRSTSPKERQVDLFVRRLKELNFFRNLRHEQEFKRQIVNSRYIRGEGFLRLLSSGLISCNTKLRTVNDYPFTPFSQLVQELHKPGVPYSMINAVPDDMFTADQLEKRLALVRDHSIGEYMILPKEGVLFSLLIFDESQALLYCRPGGADACSFAEGLSFNSTSAIRSLIEVFEFLASGARGFMKETGLTAESVHLEQLRIIRSDNGQRDSGQAEVHSTPS